MRCVGHLARMNFKILVKNPEGKSVKHRRRSQDNIRMGVKKNKIRLCGVY